MASFDALIEWLILRNISLFPVYIPLLQPLCTHYYIDPQTNTVTSSPDRNTPHGLGSVHK